MKTIATLDDLKEVIRQPRALVFFYVMWAVQARLSKQRIAHLIDSWNKDPSLYGIAYTVNLSEQRGDIWDSVRSWLRCQGMPVDPFTYGGNGALLWVRAGQVITYTGNAGEMDLKELNTITRRVFEEME
jgi:hypothetical protein